MDKNYQALKKFCAEQGADLFGVADISSVKKEFALAPKLKNKFRRALCIGVRLSSSALEEIEDGPTKIYFHHYRTVNAFLDQLSFKISNLIQRQGFSALPIPASQIIDWENQKAHLSHKKIGVLAGLGWIGRNNLLVNKELGSGFRIASVLTDMPLKADKPKIADCGKCFLCVKICPAGAIREAARDFQHQKCFEKLKEFQRQRLVDQYICGICLKACQGAKR
jgi:epoxyqueuosine reductase QueG